MADELTKDIVLKEQLNTPFTTYPKKKKKKDIETLSEFEQNFLEAWEQVFTPKKKPVKYSGEGAAEALLSLTGPIPVRQEIFKGYKFAKWNKMYFVINVLNI